MAQFNGGFRSPSSFQSAPPSNSVSFGGPVPTAGHKRDSSGRPLSPAARSPSDSGDSGNFVKLFVGSVPRTITEEEIRPIFAEQGNVLEVALIKDKNTGQQQGCCFIKYATFEEAERAIRFIHNQRTLPGGTAPVQVRYADGERERLVEHKLFVGCLNRQASEKEIEEIFSPYGRVDDVYIMKDEHKQSRGCAFVKFPTREMAQAAMSALNGTYVMRGCDQPIVVRNADPKRTRLSDARVGGPGFGGPGFHPRPVAGPYGGPRPGMVPGGSIGSRGPPMGWRPSAGGPGPGVGPRPQGGPGAYTMAPRGGGPGTSQLSGGLGNLPVPAGGASQAGPAQGPFNLPAQIGGPGQAGGVGQIGGSSARPQQQYFQQATQRPQAYGQQTSLQPPQQQSPSVSIQSQQQPQIYGQQVTTLQPQPLQQLQQQPQIPPTLQPQGSLPAHSSQQFQPLQTALHPHQILQPQQQQYTQLHPAPQQYQPLHVPQQLQQPSLGLQQGQLQQAPLTVPSLPQQQALSLPVTYQNQLQPQAQPQSQPQLQPQPQPQPQSQQQVQPQMQMQPQIQTQAQIHSQSGIQTQPHPQSHPQSQPQTQPPQQQQVFQVTPLQTPLQQQQSWMLTSQAQTLSSSVPLPVTPSVPVVATCNWTEHTSPEGHKYYYNSVTGESKWEKPDELTKFEQQQQQQHQQQIPLPQPVPSLSYGASSTTTQNTIQLPGFTYGQPQLNNGSVDQFRQQIR